jgi:hypothetical protein
MDGKSVTLKHIVRRHGKQAVFFCDGAATAEDGLLTLPTDRPAWIRKAWLSGYNLNPDTDERLMDWAAVERLMNAESVEVSTESTEETSEDSHAGGQSEDTDGVRETEQGSSDSVPEGGSPSDGGGSTDVREETTEEQSVAGGPDLADEGRRPARKRNSRENGEVA